VRAERRIDRVTVALARGEPVAIPWASREALLKRLPESMRTVRDAFTAVGTSAPVSLTPEQRAELLDAIQSWVTQDDEVPEGIVALRDALAEDLADHA
jgi:hypothetical protein